MADLGMSLYDANKQLMANEPILKIDELRNRINNLVSFLMKNEEESTWMLLCNERKDYTIFNIREYIADNAEKLKEDIEECLRSRGSVLDLTQLKDNNWEIWIRDYDTKENFVYYFFDYSGGILIYD